MSHQEKIRCAPARVLVLAVFALAAADSARAGNMRGTVIQQRATTPVLSTGAANANANASANASQSAPVAATPMSVDPAALPAGFDQAQNLVCRGGGALLWSPRDEPPPSTRRMISLIFQTAMGEVGPKGENLKPSECALLGHRGYLPPNVVFEANARPWPLSNQDGTPLPTPQGIQPYMSDETHYWRFAVIPKHGYYEAVAHGAIPGPGAPSTVPGASVASNIPDAPIQAAAPRSSSRLLRQAGSTIETNAGQPIVAAQPATESRTVSVARATPAAIAQPTTPLIDPGQPSMPTAAPIQGVGAGARRAAGHRMDCTSNSPRISNIQGRISSNQKFTINGSCFGTAPGSIQVIGQFDGGNLTPAFTQWTESMIVATMPSLPSVAGHTVAVSVRRGADGRQSAARQFQYVPEMRMVDIPSSAWTPSGAFSRFEQGEAALTRIDTSVSYNRPRRQITNFKLRVNPACSLETLDAPAASGSVHSISGWDRGPAHEADVNIVWTPRCTIQKTDFVGVATHEATCTVGFELKARASCPVGVNPL